MKLGLKRNEVRIVDYTADWLVEFEKVKKEIINSTGLSENRIEHIGSTAIKEMPAKPIVDIVVGIDDLASSHDTLITNLKEIGFLRLRVERPNEIVLAKFTDETYEEKTHYIHLVQFQGDLWYDLLFFRDYLNENEVERKQYLELKLAYLQKASTGIQEYTDFKEAFVKDIFNRRTK